MCRRPELRTALAEYSQRIEVKTTSMTMIRMVCIISGLPCPTMALRARASYISCYIGRDANYEYLPGRYDLRALLRTAMLLYLCTQLYTYNEQLLRG